MDPTEVFGSRYGGTVTGLESLNSSDEFRQLVTMPLENSGSFTALLEMPTTQAMELLHFTDSSCSPAVNRVAGNFGPTLHSFETLTFPSNSLLLDRAARFSVIATEKNGNISGETASFSPTNSGAKLDRVKTEHDETDSSHRLVENQNHNQNKRKEREKKVKSSMKKTKSSEEADKLPYVHVRAPRGQATDNHSLAERARREKINARMKLLQELVPGCDKIQGTALVLDEIINHVQSLQHQVEMLSMSLAAVNPSINFNLDNILASQREKSGQKQGPPLSSHSYFPNVSLMDSSFNGESYHQLQRWHMDGYQQAQWGREEDHHQAMASTTLHSNQVKMEQ